MEQRKATGKATGRRALLGNGRPEVGNEQCLSMLTLLSLLHRLPFQGAPSFNASTQGDALG
jgi:hypothetical protein